MRTTRKATTFLLFLFATLPVIGQSNSGSEDKQVDSIPTLYWNKKPDVRKWLRENEAILKRGDGCSLTVSWYSESNRKGPGSAVHEIVAFLTLPEGEDEITRVFHDAASDSGLDVRVGVRYVHDGLLASKLPPKLELALALDGPSDDVFGEISRSEASTVRFKDWKFISVVKPIVANGMRYRYELFCENGKQFMSFFRRPVKKKPAEE